MKTASVNYSAPHFGNAYMTGMKKAMQKELLKAPAIQKLGEKYDVDVYLTSFSSRKNPNKSYFGLRFENIEPISLWRTIKDMFAKKRYLEYECINYNAHQADETEFVKTIKKLEPDTFINLL